MIFVGEQTSYTHAWIASALESGIRGGVQLLLGRLIIFVFFYFPLPLEFSANVNVLELGLVDEAKATVEKWMARWIDVVS